jgi:hypothetical protein
MVTENSGATQLSAVGTADKLDVIAQVPQSSIDARDERD